MKCAKPYLQGVMAFGCGQCMPCRINRRRLWTIRLMLEGAKHRHAWFVTLTYEDKHLPAGGTLVPRDVQLYLKRLRKAMGARRLRFYAVGEYGEKKGRPHYHLALFGDLVEKEVVEAWGLGLVDVREIGRESAAYICGYITKAMGVPEDGRYPEFARMSLRPGIGAAAMEEVWRSFYGGLTDGDGVVQEWTDVPAVVRTEARLWPLGRYLRSKLREKAGMAPGVPADVLAGVATEKKLEILARGRDGMEAIRRHSLSVAQRRQEINRSKRRL